MCGIAGYAGFLEEGLVQRMCRALEHRGPDGGGAAEFPDAGIAIGMRRLAVIDLATGDQPMFDPDGRVSLVFNGEIYNYRELRTELRSLGRSFRTSSDTEVILQAFLQWGGDAWERLEGMFALAIVDQRGGAPVLRLVRDRVGIKPLYMIHDRGRFLFASEIKALRQWSESNSEIDLQSISNYLALRYVPGPASLFAQIRKAPAGHELIYTNGILTSRAYWRPPGPNIQRRDQSSGDSVSDLREALSEAVRRHMVSDVPVGAFLSGGIDSNVIVALMAHFSSAPIRTYTIGFAGDDRVDLDGAAETARAIGARHTEIECSVDDFRSVSDIAYALDEPVGDPIVVPMSVLSREARKDVTVVLSGEGADELFGGYLFHRKLRTLVRARRAVPSALWAVGATAVAHAPPSWLDSIFDYPGELGERGRARVASLLRQVGSGSLPDLYHSAISLFDAAEIAQAGALDLPHPAYSSGADSAGTDLQRILALQYADWLPDDILMKADKLSMMHSLECRVPFMDSLVIQAAARCPDRDKLRNGTTKWALRRVGAELLGERAARAPKRAFYAPLQRFLADPRFQQIMAETLDSGRLRRRGLISPAYVELLRTQIGSGGFLPEKQLFSIMMLELWFERFCPQVSWA